MREFTRRGEQQAFGGPGGIIAAAAHELKTPLTVISGIAQMLDDDSLGLTDQERLQYVQRLKMVSTRTLRLLQHLTVSYRLEQAGQLAFTFALEPVNVREVCEAALHELTPYAAAHNQKLQLVRMARAPMVVANRDILYDVLVNLVDNAIKHNEPHTAVRLAPATRGDHVRLGVHDNGIGISRSQLSHLRQNLGRGPQPLAGHAGSSGLGLYIVGQLAGAMGGTLGLARARQGTTFFVDLLRSKQLSLW